MPSWMSALHKKFINANTHVNLQLFIAKLIINEPKASIFLLYSCEFINHKFKLLSYFEFLR